MLAGSWLIKALVQLLPAGLPRADSIGVDGTVATVSVVASLALSAEESGESFRQMPSGAAHDTQCVASLVPSAMVFVPCVDGLSHTPLESADPADAALAAEVVYSAIRARAT